MTAAPRHISAGTVGRPHGLDGSFYVAHPTETIAVGDEVEIAGRSFVIERLAGTDRRPIVRVNGVADRDAAGGLRGERLLVAAGPLEEGEFFTADLIGCRVEGLGEVRGVIRAPSCDLLEVGDEKVLVPLIGDAVTSIDLEARLIEVDRRFLGLAEDGAE